MAVILMNCCQHVEGFFPYFQPFPYIRIRPARPQNPIYVQADRISKVWKDNKRLTLRSREGKLFNTLYDIYIKNHGIQNTLPQ